MSPNPTVKERRGRRRRAGQTGLDNVVVELVEVFVDVGVDLFEDFDDVGVEVEDLLELRIREVRQLCECPGQASFTAFALTRTLALSF